MAYIRMGSCNHCGECCLPPIIQRNVCIVPPEDRCRFYTDTENSELDGHCLIYGRGRDPVKNAEDRFGAKIITAQIAWFESNCIDYPRSIDAERGNFPPVACGFSFQEEA